MKTNCKELEYIRDNVLTEQKSEGMNTRYKRKPILRFFKDINRCDYQELSLIGKWLKALQGISGLDKVEKDLVESEEKYWHARLQLKIAASIKQSDDGNIICLERYYTEISTRSRKNKETGCRVPKLFRQETLPQLMAKLTDKKIEWAVKQVINKGESTELVAAIYGVSRRRIQQLVK